MNIRSASRYKNSDWYENISNQWKVKRLKYISSHIIKKRLPKDGEIKISPENVESTTGKIRNYHSKYETEGQEFQKGDILFNKISVRLNKVIHCHFDGLSMGEMIVIRPHKISGGFLSKVMTSRLYIEEIDSLSRGVILPRPPVEGILNSFIPNPPFQEQRLISLYLDNKIEQIDSLIEKLKNKIKLLEEQRTLLINKCITKGLNPNVEMKDSDVEWVGEIPKHWGLKKLKFVSIQVTEKRLPLNDDKKISPENVETHTGKILNYYSEYDTEGQSFKSGDILFNKLGVYLNKVVYCEFNGLSMGEMIVIRPKSIRGTYLHRVLNSSKFIDYMNSLSEGVKLPRPPVHGIFNSFIPIPSESEQLEIVTYLNKKLTILDKLVEKLLEQISLVSEYRQSLISSVVTGNIRVTEDMV